MNPGLLSVKGKLSYAARLKETEKKIRSLTPAVYVRTVSEC